MTLNTFLIPTDGSDVAQAAARRGFDLATQLEANVHVLSVADSSIATGAGYSGDSASIRRRLREQADVRATALRETATARGLEATAAVREGIPAMEIVDYADEHGIDAIVIGTVGRGGVARAIIGSVADKVVRMAPVPVVTVTPAAVETADRQTEFDSILFPTDGSERSTDAIDRCLALADALEATVHFLTVIDDDRTETLRSVVDTGANPASERTELADEHLETLATRARADGHEVVVATTSGKPATEILEYVKTGGIDMVAMGTAGRSGFERAILGSVTDRVIRTAPVPVVTVRPNEM
ncbi:universal stress protein [Natrialbaceae archaeon A-chndr2]